MAAGGFCPFLGTSCALCWSKAPKGSSWISARSPRVWFPLSYFCELRPFVHPAVDRAGTWDGRQGTHGVPLRGPAWSPPGVLAKLQK